MRSSEKVDLLLELCLVGFDSVFEGFGHALLVMPVLPLLSDLQAIEKLVRIKFSIRASNNH